MKSITRVGNYAVPVIFAIVLYLLLLIASHIFALHSPALAQSSSTTQSNLKEGKGTYQPEPKKVKSLGSADEFNRGVPRSSLKGYLKAARDRKKRVRSLNLTIYRFVPGFDEIVSSIYGWILVWFSDALGSG